MCGCAVKERPSMALAVPQETRDSRNPEACRVRAEAPPGRVWKECGNVRQQLASIQLIACLRLKCDWMLYLILYIWCLLLYQIMHLYLI